jgi:RND family efflux transporter MFP subunit
MRAEATGGSQERSFAGVVRAGRETELSFRVPGRIDDLIVRVGDRVSAGSLIAQLERDDFEIALRRAEADLTQSRAAERNAVADLERIRGLYEGGNAAQTELDAALAASQSGSARVDSSRQSREQARRQLAYTTLRAPVDGSIAAVPVEVNENVKAGQQIVLLTSGSRPEVEVAMPEAFITQVVRGARVTVSLDAIDALGDRALEATVTEVGVASTGGTTTFPVTARLSDTTADVRSGMAATALFRFKADSDEQRIYLPSYAIGEDRAGRFVFALEPSDQDGVGIVRRLAVDVGALNGEQLEIVSGVTEGQEIITAGVRRLTDGQRVKRLDPVPDP